MQNKTLHNRIYSCRGVARLVLILSLVAAALAVFVLGVPLYHYFADRSAAYGCGSALATANDQLKIWYLTAGSDPTAEEAKAEVTKAMNGWTDLCPGGGDCYIVQTGDADCPYHVVCALHDDDAEEASVLNARSALAQLQELQGDALDKVTVTLNSEGYSAVLDPTRTTLSPTGKELRAAGGTLMAYNAENGVITWFCYADGSYIRTWQLDAVGSITSADGWSVRYG